MPTTTTTVTAPPALPAPAPGSDHKPPKVKAELDRIEVRYDKGWFRVDFSCHDRVDRRPTCVAYLNGIRVRDGQKVFLERSSRHPWAAKKGHVLYVRDDSFLLTVTGTDDSGNSKTATAKPYFKQRDRRWRCW
jgi:hypothetical protein